MEEGIREATGSRVGKTIVFARNHVHAVHLAELFSEMYPQYGSARSAASSTTRSRSAEQLIDDFKNKDNEPDDRHLGRHARHGHRRARGREPRLRQAGQVAT